MNLLESVENTLLYNQKQIRRLRRLCKILLAVGLLGWLAAGAVLVGRWSGDTLNVPRLALFSFQDSAIQDSAGLAGEAARPDLDLRDGAAARQPTNAPSTADVPATDIPAGDIPAGEVPAGEVPEVPEAAAAGPVAPVAPVVTGEIGEIGGTVTAEVDDLVLQPELYLGRDVVVTGSVVRLFNRYRLRSQDGLSTIVIDVDALPARDRAALDGAFERASLLDHVRARIEGRVEREASAAFQLAARELALLARGDPPIGPGRDEEG